jgi:hypothetical protein
MKIKTDEEVEDEIILNVQSKLTALRFINDIAVTPQAN